MKTMNKTINHLIAVLFITLSFPLLADTVTEPVRTFKGHTGIICIDDCVAFSQDGRFILSGSSDNTLKLWDVSSGQEIRTFTGHSSYVVSVTMSSDGRYALSGSFDNTLKLWDVSSGQEIRTFTGHSSYVISVALSSDGRYALSGSEDRTLKLWDVNSGKEIRSFTGHSSSVYSVGFSPDGQTILSGSMDNTLKLWDVNSGQEVRTFTGHSSSVMSVAFSPDGRYVLSGSQDKTLKLWDVNSGDELRSFTGHFSYVWSVAFSPDGRYVLSGSGDTGDNTLRLWNVNNGEEIRSFTGHSDSVTSAVFSPDGRYVLSGSSDKTLKLWNVNTGEEIRSFTGHFNRVRSVAFSPDGLTILSGSDDSTLKLWDVSSGQEIRTFTGHSGYVFSVTMSSDGRYALSGSYDKTLKLWPIVIVEPPPSTGTGKVGQAIIIASGGAEIGNTLFRYSNQFTQRMYRILKQRGFEDGDIHYINPWPPDIDLDGHPDDERHDYKLFDPDKEIAAAFAQAANLQAGQQFIFYLHGHARQDHFNVMPSVGYELSATRLRALLATIPAGVQQVIILNSCYSGSFMDELAGVENRVVVSSTDDRTLAWSTEYVSFADTFLKSLRRAHSVEEAFLNGLHTVSKEPKYFRDQTPWLDDDRDGMYTSNDGRLAAKITIGEEGVHAAPAPSITRVHDRMVLGDNEAATTLWVKVTPAQDQIRKVQAAIINPNFVAKDYQGQATDFTREEVELLYN
ncbi:MAG: hypothetical protein DRR19_22685, partial [Candidatus Parabeggiatoa sp. nov. 1]